MAVEAEALAWRQADIPDPHALVLRQKPLADAAIGALLLALEFGADLGRPRGLGGGDGFLLEHAQGHEKSSSTQMASRGAMIGQLWRPRNCGFWVRLAIVAVRRRLADRPSAGGLR